MTNWGATKKQGGKEPSLSIPGKLPFEGYASEVKMADLVKMLVHKGALSVEDYELLVMRQHFNAAGCPGNACRLFAEIFDMGGDGFFYNIDFIHQIVLHYKTEIN